MSYIIILLLLIFPGIYSLLKKDSNNIIKAPCTKEVVMAFSCWFIALGIIIGKFMN